jgi:tetratricopeptide (TPR) repeat protein
VKNAVILEFYHELNTTSNLHRFAEQVSQRYTEGTLQRLLAQRKSKTREPALVALRLLGTMDSNAAIASCLRDRDPHVRELAEGALWSIWFRGDSEENQQELQRLTRLIAEQQYAAALAGLDALIRRAPKYAEAYNQRAILHWRRGDYKRSVLDCERTLRLNPFHFGAQSGLAQCYLQLRKPVEALRAFRDARKISPHLEGIEENIRSLEKYLREQRRRKDGRK